MFVDTGVFVGTAVFDATAVLVAGCVSVTVGETGEVGVMLGVKVGEADRLAVEVDVGTMVFVTTWAPAR